MSDDLVLAVDLGTTAMKVSTWNPRLDGPVAIVRLEYALSVSRGRVECDAGTYLAALREGIRVVTAGSSGRIRAISFATQGETLLVVDRDDRPVSQAIVWLDSRATADAALIGSRLGLDLFRRTTGLPALVGGTPLAKTVQLCRTYHSELADGGAILLLEDYLIATLTGRRVTTASLQTSTGWLDLATGDYWRDALHAAGLERQYLPSIVPSGHCVGPISDTWSALLGLPPGVLVVTGGMDQTVGALGAGAIKPGIVNVTFGSALTAMSTVDSSKRRPETDLTRYRHIVDGKDLLLAFLPTGAILQSWFKRLLADATGSDIDYDRIDELAAAVPPGSDGVIALPQFGEGPGAETAAASGGGFLGLTLGTTAGHLARSLMEASAYVVKDALIALEAAGVEIAEVRSSGGGAHSWLWQQITADVCGRVLHVLDEREVTSRGAAALACSGAGLRDVRQDLSPGAMTTVEPRRENAGRYETAERDYRNALAAVQTLSRTPSPADAIPAVGAAPGEAGKETVA